MHLIKPDRVDTLHICCWIINRWRQPGIRLNLIKTTPRHPIVTECKTSPWKFGIQWLHVTLSYLVTQTLFQTKTSLLQLTASWKHRESKTALAVCCFSVHVSCAERTLQATQSCYLSEILTPTSEFFPKSKRSTGAKEEVSLCIKYLSVVCSSTSKALQHLIIQDFHLPSLKYISHGVSWSWNFILVCQSFSWFAAYKLDGFVAKEEGETYFSPPATLNLVIAVCNLTTCPKIKTFSSWVDEEFACI